MLNYTSKGIEVNGKFISLEEITKNVNAAKMQAENLVLLSISWPETRGCDAIDEQIALPKADAEKVKSIILGKQAYFGEIAGKHSEIYGEIEEDEITIQDDEIAVTAFLRENPSRHTYNHSFIHAFCEAVECEMTEISDEDFKYLSEIV